MTTNERKETGWDRVKRAYTYDRDNLDFPRELYELIMMTAIGMMMGYAYGGIPAARHARQRYIEKSNAAIYSSRIEATGSSYNAGMRGFIRYGYRWGWRTALLAAGFHGLSTSLSVYQDKQDLKNYTIASVVTGSVYRINFGLRGMVGGAFVGALVGIPAGLCLMGVQKLQGETFLERNKRLSQERLMAMQQDLLIRREVLTPLLLGSTKEKLSNPCEESSR